MRIGVVANRTKSGALAFLKNLREAAEHYRVELLWEESTAKLLHVQGHSMEVLRERADLLLVAGGDGSILRVVHAIYPSQSPILGINIGGLGFLTALGGDEIGAALAHIVAGKLRYSERLVLL
jgi:NAD+ kinase